MKKFTKEEIAVDVINKGLELAEENIENLETGFLSFKIKNILPEDEENTLIENIRECSMYFPLIVKNNNIPLEFHRIGLIFNYFFDKIVEIFYKKYNGLDCSNINFELFEIYDEYVVDVPYNLRRILLNRLLKIVNLSKALWNYMEASGYMDMETEDWLSIYFYTASLIGLKFAEQIDFNDNSENNIILNP